MCRAFTALGEPKLARSRGARIKADRECAHLLNNPNIQPLNMTDEVYRFTESLHLLEASNDKINAYYKGNKVS